MTERVRMSSGGGIVLGSGVVCDGFDEQCNVRVQTHIHRDHMDKFASSKGNGDIVCSKITRELLIVELNNELAYRSNLIPLDFNVRLYYEDNLSVVLLDAGHMAGSAQVMVTHQDGVRTGYSGDFSWPLDSVIEQPDVLVLDATYGSPDAVRRFSQRDADERFVEEALRRVKDGPVFVWAHRGTLHRAIGLLDDVPVPLLGSKLRIRESSVYRKYGHVQADLMDANSDEGKSAIASGHFVMFEGPGDVKRERRAREHQIVLSAHRIVQEQEPLLAFSDYSCRIALSDHADFEGVLAYVDAVRPKRVLTDASRARYAGVLALEIASRFGIPAAAMP